VGSERDGGLGLARFSAVCPSVGRPYVRKWPFMARRYGRCCMYGPNYVKLSRVFAVQLLSVFIGHYTALPPVRFDPHPPLALAPQPCHHRLHSPRPHPYTATHTHTHTHTHTLLATQTSLGSGNHDMSRLPTPAYPNDVPIHGLTDIPLATPALSGYWVWYPRRPSPARAPRHCNTHYSRLKPRHW
jgi:hypothetical protein